MRLADKLNVLDLSWTKLCAWAVNFGACAAFVTVVYVGRG